jgi:hypothetical protein
MKNKTNHSLILGTAILLGVIGQTAIISTANAISPVAYNQTYGNLAESDIEIQKKHIATVDTQDVDTVLDIPLRLGGFVITVVGTGLFIGTSPITGLMTAIYPHNAIDKAADFLVVRPGRYTFVRPTGSYNYDSRSYGEK